jgi:salicylate biosynthesis isochorismate synthase
VPLTIPVEDVLFNLSQTHPDAYLFAFARSDACFLGASPERLIEFRDGYLSTWALAGSAPRSAVAAEDARFGSGLLRSVKDRHEHALVVNELRSVLARHCRQLDIPEEPSLRKLPHVQHLMTPSGARRTTACDYSHCSNNCTRAPRLAAFRVSMRSLISGLKRSWIAVGTQVLLAGSTVGARVSLPSRCARRCCAADAPRCLPVAESSKAHLRTTNIGRLR